MISISDALKIASKYGLELEVNYYIENGYTPEEALNEWDIYPTL